jgi:PhoPQ-activated pathogenicity-related protein
MVSMSEWSLLISLVLLVRGGIVPSSEGHGAESPSYFTASPSTALADYVNKKDTAYQWQVHERRETDQGTYYYLQFVSQQWQGILWQHHLAVFFPHRATFPNTMLLVLRHLEQKQPDLNSLIAIAQETGSPCSILYGVPNQPLFEGKEEEELINHTFLEYIRTGDKTWPLLFPMVKSTVRSMDALQALSQQHNQSAVDGFVVTGHSKRAHTAWLTAAVDTRVKGIMPVAFDLLNSPAQIAHHYHVFGQLSSSAQAGKGVLEQIDSPRGQSLIQMIDAYGYRQRLTLPKLIVLGTNDDYSPTDALNLYWEGLPGLKWVLYLPNTDHVGAYFSPLVNATAFAFMRSVASGEPLPALQWQFEERGEGVTIRIKTSSAATNAKVWTTSALGQDFRAAQWHENPARQSKGGSQSEIEFTAEIKKPVNKFTALFGQIEYQLHGKKVILSTQTRIVKGSKVK